MVSYKAEVEISLPELSSSKTFKWSFYIDQSKKKQKYGLFVGSDILESLGIDLNYSTKSIQWGDSFAPMRGKDPIDPINSDNEEMAAHIFNDE